MKKLELIGRKEPQCAYCNSARRVLEQRGIPYTYVDINDSPEALQKLSRLGLRTVPQLFIDNEHVGDSKVAKTITLNRKVKKRNGCTEDFTAEKINAMAEWSTIDTDVCWSSIVMDAMHKLPEGDVTTTQIQESLVQAALDFKEPKYNKVAGRLLLGQIRKSSLASDSFVEFYHQMVDDGYWRDMNYTNKELKFLEDSIDHNKDVNYGYPSLRQLFDKYMLKDEHSRLLEYPQYTYMGIAMSMMQDYSLDDVVMYYEKTSDHKINLPSPVLGNQRTPSNTGVSCVISSAGDSLHGIEATKHIAFMATASSAGLGVEYDVRSPKDDVRQGYAKAGGKLPHYKVLDKVVKEASQKSRGGGATVTFNVLDPEIETLLNLKLPRTVEERRIELLDYSLCINNDFLRRAAKKQDWCVVSKRVYPELHDAFYNDRERFGELMDYALNNNIGRKISAFDVLVQYLSARQETGRMYMFNIDNVNDHTPFKETVRLGNLCNEIALPTHEYNHITDLYKDHVFGEGTTAQCFLSALDVARIQTDQDYYECAYIVLKSLDNLISSMSYPFPQFKDSANKYRSVGVGMTNMAYALAKNGLGYKDKEYIHFLSERHYYMLTKASVKLAQERGEFEYFSKTKWKDGWLPIDDYKTNVDDIVDNKLIYDWDKLRSLILDYGVRFSTLCAHMPCESSSGATNSTNSLYPIRSEMVIKDSRAGRIQFFAPECDKYSYDIAWDVDYKDLVDMYAIVQKFTDQSTSADTYLDYSKYEGSKVPMSVLVKDFLYANKMGLKTLYYQNFRTGRGADDIEKEPECESCSL